MAKQTKIYKTKHFEKLLHRATNPAKIIVDQIRPLTKKIDSVRDWEAIVSDNIVPFLTNPLTKQTGTYNDKKSLKEFVDKIVEDHTKRKFYYGKNLSVGKDRCGREYRFCIDYNKRNKSVVFSIKQWLPSLDEDGEPSSAVFSEPESRGISTFDVATPFNQNDLWEAHFKISCEFNAIVNRNCLCERRSKIQYGAYKGWFEQHCVCKKAINSNFCFAHLHEGWRR